MHGSVSDPYSISNTYCTEYGVDHLFPGDFYRVRLEYFLHRREEEEGDNIHTEIEKRQRREHFLLPILDHMERPPISPAGNSIDYAMLMLMPMLIGRRNTMHAYTVPLFLFSPHFPGAETTKKQNFPSSCHTLWRALSYIRRARARLICRDLFGDQGCISPPSRPPDQTSKGKKAEQKEEITPLL